MVSRIVTTIFGQSVRQSVRRSGSWDELSLAPRCLPLTSDSWLSASGFSLVSPVSCLPSPSFFLVLYPLRALGGTSGAQPAIDERIQGPVHHALDVTGFNASAQVFDHAV